MPAEPQRIDWMPSPPLAPDVAALDLNHLESMTLGDVQLEREVLSMFAEQALRLLDMMDALPGEAGVLAHTLKGSARGIGAFAVAEAAARLEVSIRNRDKREAALEELKSAVAEVRIAIAAFLRQG